MSFEHHSGRGRTRFWPVRLAALLAALVLGVTGLPGSVPPSAPASPGLHLRADGAIAQTSPTLRLVGRQNFGGTGFTGNVALLGGVAYVGSYGTEDACPELGVRIVDLTNPASLRWMATIAAYPGTTAEHPVVAKVETPSFRGTLLGVGIQRCDHAPDDHGHADDSSPVRTGLALFDVTDPSHPVELGFYDNGPLFPGVHEFDFAIRGSQVLALLALHRWDRETGVGDFQVLDVSDPRAPRRLADWGVWSGLGDDRGQGCYRTNYAHSVRSSPFSDRAYVSYWDSGLLIFDLSDPAAPRVEGVALDRSFDGNVHSADELAGGILLVTEEIGFSALPLPLRVGIQSAAGQMDLYGCELPQEERLPRDGSLGGTVVALSAECTLAAAPGAVALYDETFHRCRLADAAQAAVGAGAVALLVVQDADQPFFEDTSEIPPPLLEDLPDSLGLPVVLIARAEASALRRLAAEGPVQAVLPHSRPFGGLRIWDINDPARPVLRSVYRPQEAVHYPPPGPGGYTIHNVLAFGHHALVSAYSAGLRLIDLGNPDRPVEIASFVSPAASDPHGELPTAPMVWGVAKEGQLVVASDMNGGLFVLRLDGLP